MPISGPEMVSAKFPISLSNRLIEPRSPIPPCWGEAAEIPDLHEAGDKWGVAAKANIAWLAEFQSRNLVITEEKVREAAEEWATGYEMMKSQVGWCGLMADLVEAAAENKESGKGVVELLLRRQDIRITAGAVAVIARNSGVWAVRSLPRGRGGIRVTEDVAKAVASKENGRETIGLLLNSGDF
ncbi:hypothetical protein FGG08_004504 [Glutinoglossum americanum]|uniref:Uncharacterized protein n=1 Tax=Glutinoglossum americanum TaxID=1670608 RepID=A0A9P8I7C9_9PEZI|nr:hypothetical protein FGG08_004504 [Glutinoglossum americanum]